MLHEAAPPPADGKAVGHAGKRGWSSAWKDNTSVHSVFGQCAVSATAGHRELFLGAAGNESLALWCRKPEDPAAKMTSSFDFPAVSGHFKYIFFYSTADPVANHSESFKSAQKSSSPAL